MRASVIIPTYLREDLFPQALATATAQDFPAEAYEILVVDNAPIPRQEVRDLCLASTGRTVRYIHEPRNGLHHARHAGARAARGEILVYIDDDVLCPPTWLAAITDPYQESCVAMVGGKVMLRYEGTPPGWLQEFQRALSALDMGEIPRAFTPYDSPVGCNISVRRSVLFECGGFNPDGFGDRRLVYLRGDGECGLARKVHNAGLIVWYAPQAWLEHRVPAGRMTEEYIEWRSALSGIEAAYAGLRYGNMTTLHLLLQSGRSMLASVYHRGRAGTGRLGQSQSPQQLAIASWHQHKACQQLRQALSKNLRAHTRRASYLEADD